MSKYIIPVFILIIITIGFFKKAQVFDCFTQGCKESVSLTISIFPFICAILIAIELFSLSGLNTYFSKILAPIFKFFGIPPELCELLIIRPLSGNGSIAMLEKIFQTYGPDSYISRCGAVIVGASETVFYISTVYFSTTKVKKLRYGIPIALLSCYLGAVFSCFICRFM